MKLTATIRVDIVTQTSEAADFLLKTITREVGSGHRMAFVKDRAGTQQAARIERASITRVRPAPRSKTKAHPKR